MNIITLSIIILIIFMALMILYEKFVPDRAKRIISDIIRALK